MQPDRSEPAAALLAQHGRIPLPPYIRKGLADEADRERYQTVYAEAPGSVAAPTAGLHFTLPLLEELRERGIARTQVTLHVGLGTFEPIRGDDPSRHVMHAELGEVPQPAVKAIQECKQRGNRVIAVGTTATRALESAARDGSLRPWSGQTSLFIKPPYRFNVIDGLITNFHLPKTTLLLLVGAFAGVELLQQAYETAVAMNYRFYSYGDAMLIL
jgi:S-adenosylmethionine:tRNA ribosyltransferase-isomerase